MSYINSPTSKIEDTLVAKIRLVSDSTVKKSVQITMIAIVENSHSFLDIAPLNLNLLLFNRL
jgi:hypothetical protein